MKKLLLSVLSAAVILFGVIIPGTVCAASSYEVIFYTDASKTAVHDTQHVEFAGHPAAPSNPASFEKNGYRYEFDHWSWDIGGGAVAQFSFTDEFCEIWGDTAVFASYTEYLAEGYELIVIYSGGTVFVGDTETPVQEILKGYTGITSAYTQIKPDYVSGSGSEDPSHTHSYDYNSPSWSWKIEDGNMTATVSYSCTCGSKATEKINPSYIDRKGVRTYTAADGHGNEAMTSKTLTYTVTLDGAAQAAGYGWGDICTLSADTCRAWYQNSADEENKLADGTATYTFAVTSNVDVVTSDTTYTKQQAAVMMKVTSSDSGKAEISAKWSLPDGADVKSVIIYRGYTTTGKTVDAETVIEKGTAFDTKLLVKNGSYTLYVSGLTPSYYQHCAIQITYKTGAETHVLTSTAQKILPNGAGQ